MNEPTLILIPGLLSDEIVWQHAVEHFSKTMPVIIADHTTQDNLTDMAADALGLTEGPLMVVGHSLGARIALEMLRQAPERIDRVAFLDARTEPIQDGEPAMRQSMIDLGFNEGLQAVSDSWLPPMVNPASHGNKNIMGPLRDMVLRMSPELLERQLRALMTRADVELVISAITCPTLVAVGRQDGFSTVAMHEELAARIPHSKLVIYEDTGHFSPFESPELVTASLVEWIESEFKA
ncbi:MAG: alpha/beta hydrolase [Rhizobiaceae bacterium]|nr:alpha/beta hydrolase [Rhizobiaceae bacterium]